MAEHRVVLAAFHFLLQAAVQQLLDLEVLLVVAPQHVRHHHCVQLQGAVLQLQLQNLQAPRSKIPVL